MKNPAMNVLEYFKEVSTFVFDLDGVLTDGTVLVLNDGLQARQMHVKDGLALQMALKNGYNVIIISGGSSEPVIRRLQKLGVTEVYLDIKDKLLFLDEYLSNRRLGWRLESTAAPEQKLDASVAPIRREVPRSHQTQPAPPPAP